PGVKKFRMTCSDCDAVFTYERSDAWRNYVHGGERVSCPNCGHECRHFGATGFGGDSSRWQRVGFGEYRWTLPLVTLAFSLVFVAGCIGDDTVNPSSDAASDAFIDSSSSSDGNDAGSADVNGDASDGFDGYTPPLYRRVFITSSYVQANFGGVAGGDALCNAAASDAFLGGTWVSWTSTPGNDVASRMTHGLVPYKLLDGTVVANDWLDLTSGSIRNPIDRDEHGNLVGLDAGGFPQS